MQVLIPLAGLLGIEIEVLKDRLKRSAVFFALIGLFTALALVFALVALNVWLSARYGPIVAPLLIAGAGFVLALLTWLVMALGERRQAGKARVQKRASDSTALVTTAALTALPILMRNSAARKIALPLGALAAVWLLNNSERHED